MITAESIPWTLAQGLTAAMGGGWHLATITSAAEDAFVSGLLPSSGLADRSHYWLGGTFTSIWNWVTGEVWSPVSYTNWWLGEPNYFGIENFLAYDLRSGNWGWNNAADTLSGYPFARGYVIERTGSGSGSGSVPLPGTLALLALGFGLGGVALRRPRGG